MSDTDIFGLAPEFVERAKEFGRQVSLEVVKHRRDGVVQVKYTLISPSSNFDIDSLVDELADKLIWGHATAFGMKGTISEAE